MQILLYEKSACSASKMNASVNGSATGRHCRGLMIN